MLPQSAGILTMKFTSRRTVIAEVALSPETPAHRGLMASDTDGVLSLNFTDRRTVIAECEITPETLVYRGQWATSKTYGAGDLARYKGDLWRCDRLSGKPCDGGWTLWTDGLLIDVYLETHNIPRAADGMTELV